jgi:hypothetical protein
LTYSVDGAEVPGEIVRDNERVTILLKRHAEKKTFSCAETLTLYRPVVGLAPIAALRLEGV